MLTYKQAEHCSRADSDDVFTTSNYGLPPCSQHVISPGLVTYFISRARILSSLAPGLDRESVLCIDNLLVRIH